jgi:hypothetical protein
MKNQIIIRKLVRLARLTAHLAADGEKARPELGRDERTRGIAQGYLRSARILQECEEWRTLDESR